MLGGFLRGRYILIGDEAGTVGRSSTHLTGVVETVQNLVGQLQDFGGLLQPERMSAVHAINSVASTQQHPVACRDDTPVQQELPAGAP